MVVVFVPESTRIGRTSAGNNDSIAFRPNIPRAPETDQTSIVV